MFCASRTTDFFVAWSVGEGSYLLIRIGAVIPFIVRELPVAGVELVARIVEHHIICSDPVYRIQDLADLPKLDRKCYKL